MTARCTIPMTYKTKRLAQDAARKYYPGPGVKFEKTTFLSFPKGQPRQVKMWLVHVPCNTAARRAR